MYDFFKKYQKLLLSLANTPEGKYLLGFPDEKDIIIKLSPNSVHFLRGFDKKKPVIQAYFKTYDFVAVKLGVVLEKILIANEEWKPVNLYNAFLHYSDIKRGKYPHIYLTTTIFNTPGLANSIHSGSSGVYATVRAGNNLSFNGSFFNYFDSVNYALDRLFTTWDTSSLTSSATISSAFERIVGTGATTNPDTCTLILVAHTSASNTTLATSDWGNIASTTFGSVSFASFATGGNNDITLNASGLAAISKTSYTKIGARTDKEIAATAPTADNHLTFNVTLGYLSVTYTLPSTGMVKGTLNMMGIGN